MKYGNLTLGQIEAGINKIGGEEAFLRFLRGELAVSAQRWRREADGLIRFSVTSDGASGEAWIPRLEGKGSRVGDDAKNVLRSPDFQPTSGVTTEIAVLPGTLFKDDQRTTGYVRAEAQRRKLTKPNAEVACLIRETFTDEEIEAMGFWWIIAMHESIKDSDGDPYLLGTSRSGVGRWFSACRGNPDGRWNREDGFAFAASK